ncbi:hypothetical protein [Nitrososphaera sp.]|uniref:hypothetical protein n=1 Tax=Nitrososphaera sp. TaxID=1971748 RepID=UPI00307F1C53
MNLRNLAIIAIIAGIAATTPVVAFAGHAFESGAASGTLPVATTVLLAGQVMRPGDYMPVVDFSPNYVTGHLLLRAPCDADGNPAVIPVGGHIDEIANRTYVDQLQMNYIAHASAPGKSCVYHSHVPAVKLSSIANAGPPRVTDIGLLNVGTKNVVFRTGNTVSFTVLTVAGEINPPNGYGPASAGNGQLPAPFNTPKQISSLIGMNPVPPEGVHAH